MRVVRPSDRCRQAPRVSEGDSLPCVQGSRGEALSDGGLGRPRLALALALAAAVVLLDQVTKAWALSSLEPGIPVAVVDDTVRLNLVHNSGAAFSMGAGFTALLSLVAIAVVAVVVRLATHIGSAWWSVALGILLGGALGNLADRLFRPPQPLSGQVIDFIQIPYWPVFNVADVAIVGAVFLMIVLAWRGVPLRDPDHAQRREQSDVS